MNTRMLPSESADDIASVKQEKSERDFARRNFSSKLLTVADARTDVFSGRTPPMGPYLGASSGFPGINSTFGVTMHGTAAILWIERGANWTEWNKAVFMYLEDHKVDIEQRLGVAAEWQAEEANRSRKIILRLEDGGWMDEESWDSVSEETVSLILTLQTAVKDHLAGAVSFADESSEPQ